MEKEGLKRGVVEIGVATLTAIAFSLVAVLLFAFIVKVASLPSACLSPVCRVIKTVAVLLGCIAGLRSDKGLFKGAAAGLLSAFSSFLLFSLLSGGIVWELSLLLELLFGAITGAISGIIAVNLHK